MRTIDMDVYAVIDQIVASVIRMFSSDPLTWLTGGARSDLMALSGNPVIQDTTSVAQIVSLLLIAIFIVVIAVSTKRRSALLTPRSLVPAEGSMQSAAPAAAAAGPLRSQWNGVLVHLDSARESDWKIAVIEADKFVDDAFARAGYPGDSFGDRLMNIAPGTLVSLDGVWWAHKVRNRLAHETDYFLRYTEAKQAIGYFQQALEELRLI